MHACVYGEASGCAAPLRHDVTSHTLPLSTRTYTPRAPAVDVSAAAQSASSSAVQTTSAFAAVGAADGTAVGVADGAGERTVGRAVG
jgi:hypothetical protein